MSFALDCTDARRRRHLERASVDWGDGLGSRPTLLSVDLGTAATTFGASHYLRLRRDGLPFTVTLSVTDDDVRHRQRLPPLQLDDVANADPVANAGVDKTGTEGSSVELSPSTAPTPGVNDTCTRQRRLG